MTRSQPKRTPDLDELATLIQSFAPYDGSFPLRLPGVAVARSSKKNQSLQHSVQHPSLCLVAQGNKSVQIGQEGYDYNPENLMIYAVNLPVAFRITEASVAAPFLTFKLDLDREKIAALNLKLFPQGLHRAVDSRGAYVTPANTAIVKDAVRLLQTMQDEQEARHIAPLIVDEMLTRLLLSPIGPQVAQLGQVESNTERVSRAIEWIQAHYDEPLNITALAKLVHMGVSTFHAHFKGVTGMSPLQFQKNLRLQEARRLMVSTVMDAATVGRQVGYASASQFTREYSRLFGSTPRRDMTQLSLGSSGA